MEHHIFTRFVLDYLELIKNFDYVLVEFTFRSANDAPYSRARAAHSLSGLGSGLLLHLLLFIMYLILIIYK